MGQPPPAPRLPALRFLPPPHVTLTGLSASRPTHPWGRPTSRPTFCPSGGRWSEPRLRVSFRRCGVFSGEGWSAARRRPTDVGGTPCPMGGAGPYGEKLCPMGGAVPLGCGAAFGGSGNEICMEAFAPGKEMRCGAQWGAVGHNEELWSTVGRCGAQWGAVGHNEELWGTVGRCGALWGQPGPRTPAALWGTAGAHRWHHREVWGWDLGHRSGVWDQGLRFGTRIQDLGPGFGS